jgi:hypothetical protein
MIRIVVWQVNPNLSGLFQYVSSQYLEKIDIVLKFFKKMMLSEFFFLSLSVVCVTFRPVKLMRLY